MTIAVPAYCVVESCPEGRRKGDVLCKHHGLLERCHRLDGEAERRAYEHRRGWYLIAGRREGT